MRLILALTLVLTLATAVLAGGETHQIGPYIASFKMNTSTNYSAQVIKPVERPDVSMYGFVLKSNNTTAVSVSVNRFGNLTDATLEVGKALVYNYLVALGFDKNAMVRYIKIDGKDGFLVEGQNSNGDTMYRATYWLDSNKCVCGPVSVGRTDVIITSILPRDVTDGLLNSFHMQMTSQTSAYS